MSTYRLQMEELLGGVNEDTDTAVNGSRISTGVFWYPGTAMSLTAGPDHLDRADENRGTLSAPPKLIDGYAPAGRIAMRLYPNLLVPLIHLGGYTATIQNGNGTNEQQTLTTTGTPTGGTATLTFETETTAPIPFNATADQVKTALEGLRGIKPGDVRCTGGSWPVGIVVNFEGRLSGKNVGPITANSAGLTGGTSPTVAIAQTTAGAPGTTLDPDGNGMPAGASLVTFTKRATAAAKTAQITASYPEHDTFIRGNGMGVSSLAITAAGEVTAELMGLYVRRIADPGGSPAFDAASVLPLRRGDLKLTWLGGSAYTQDFNFTLANPVERGDHLGIESYYPKVLEHTGNPVRLTGGINKRTLDPDDYDAMIDARTFAASARWIGASKIGNTGKAYGMWVQMPAAQYVSGDPEDQTNARRFAANYEFEAAYDETAGYDARITLVCATTSVEAYV